MKELELPKDIRSLEFLLLNGSVKNRIIKVCEDTETELKNDALFQNCHFMFYHNATISFKSNEEYYDVDYIDASFENCDKVWYGGKLVAC